MKLTTIRRLFRFMALPGLAIVALLLWDYIGNDGRAFTPLTIVGILYLAVLAILLLLPIEHEDAAFIAASEAEPMSYHYPPTEARE